MTLRRPFSSFKSNMLLVLWPRFCHNRTCCCSLQVLGGGARQQLLPDPGSVDWLVVHVLLPASLAEVLLLHRHAAEGASRRHAQVRSPFHRLHSLLSSLLPAFLFLSVLFFFSFFAVGPQNMHLISFTYLSVLNWHHRFSAIVVLGLLILHENASFSILSKTRFILTIYLLTPLNPVTSAPFKSFSFFFFFFNSHSTDSPPSLCWSCCPSLWPCT